MGIIPLGTGNDFAGNLGIAEDLDFACDLLLKGKVRRIDLIQVDSGPYIAVVGGVGFDSEVNALANKCSRYLPGKAAYVLPVLLKSVTYRSKNISLRLDDENVQGPILMVAFGNMKSYGRGMQITPLAAMDDGLLDVCWIDPVNPFRLCRFFPTVFAGEHIKMPEVRYYRSAHVRVESSVPLDLYGDGEFLGRTPFTLRVLRQSLGVLVP
jgi:diacylglycerol kinase (ATP)